MPGGPAFNLKAATPLLTFVIFCSLARAQDFPHPKGYVCYRIRAPITVDGRLDDPAWRDVPWTDEFVDIEGDRKPRPRFRTRAKMAWDDRYFYVAARMEEPHVWGTLTAHDSVIFRDNDFEVFIEPDGDNHAYYELEINALNTTWDLFLPRPYKDRGKADNSWEIPGMKTAVHIDGTLNDPGDTDREWSVEIALPWEAFRAHANRPLPPRDGDQWRVNFSRVEWTIAVNGGKYEKVKGLKEDNWVWSPQFAVNMHRPEHWGYVQFSRRPPGKAEFRPDPAWPVRLRLLAVYYAQKEFHRANGRYAKSVAELGLARERGGDPVLTLTQEGFEAALDGLTINQESRLLPRGGKK